MSLLNSSSLEFEESQIYKDVIGHDFKTNLWVETRLFSVYDRPWLLCRIACGLISNEKIKTLIFVTHLLHRERITKNLATIAGKSAKFENKWQRVLNFDNDGKIFIEYGSRCFRSCSCEGVIVFDISGRDWYKMKSHREFDWLASRKVMIRVY